MAETSRSDTAKVDALLCLPHVERLAGRRIAALEHAQAFTWLRADLDALDRLPAGEAGFVVTQLEHWKRDPDLAAIRDVADLPADFRTLWTDVDALLERARMATQK